MRASNAASQPSTPTRSVRRARRSRGVALLEFAIAVPFLAIVVFGVVDGARALFVWVDIKNAAREGAVYGQNHPYQWELDAEGSDGGLCDGGDTIVDRAAAETDRPITVVVRYGASGTGNLSPQNCRQSSTSADAIQPGDPLRVTVETEFHAITPLVDAWFGDVAATVEVRVQG